MGDVEKGDDTELVGRTKGGHLFVVAGPVGDPAGDIVARNLPQPLSRS